MAAFVLVHGAWLGATYWREVAARLRAAGCDVYTPTLTGLGERTHLLSRSVDLELHIQDIVNVFLYEDMRDVVLVGHSYGGMVISGVAERCAGRLRHLVYLDAFVPADGDAMIDLGTPERMAWVREQAAVAGDGWLVPCPALDSFGLPAVHGAWLSSLAGPQPLKTFEQTLHLSAPAARAIPRTFIRCTAYPGFQSQAERVRSAPGWRYAEIPTSHMAPLTEPEMLTRLLLDAAEQPSGAR